VKAEPVVPTGERASSKTETVEGSGTDSTVGIRPDIAAAPAHSNVPPTVTAAESTTAETTTTAATTTNTASGEGTSCTNSMHVLCYICYTAPPLLLLRLFSAGDCAALGSLGDESCAYSG
jgi:hypothetical protein